MGPGPAELGATWLGDGRCRFRVWAPLHEEVILHILEPEERLVPMMRAPRGYHQATLEGLAPGSLYLYALANGRERPDPASRHQPQGVHGPSRVVDPGFPWEDDGFRAPEMQDLVLYEMHVGTFTSAGTFDGAAAHLQELRDLGITAVELMPVAQFPGERNWGYDGASLWAVQESYGGPHGLRRFVQACHRVGLAVHLDVVYNHLGPEGNYLGEFGPYFTDAYRTPWGSAVNFDGPGSDEVRQFFLGNALHWIREYHVDGLRLDAIHAIIDRSAKPFLEELAEAVDEESARTGRSILVVGESNRNDARLVERRDHGGTGLHGVWTDDFHHALHTLLTGESQGYYMDFGTLADLESAYRDRFAYAGRYSEFRRRRHGRSARHLPSHRFVVFAQNHDQVGNRLKGDRLGALVPPEALRLAAAVVLLSPYVPLLFMGEEYGETAPFPYFTSHTDPELAEAVRQGRKKEFSAFEWEGDPPDPQARSTFRSAVLNHELRNRPGHRSLLDLHGELLRMRRDHPALSSREPEDLDTYRDDGARLLVPVRRSGDDCCVLLFHFSGSRARVSVPLQAGRWRRVLDTGEEVWGGGGASVPDTVESSGEVSLTLEPWAAVMLERF
jgi:maltooligosyltrehalose trehalohydrolase